MTPPRLSSRGAGNARRGDLVAHVTRSLALTTNQTSSRSDLTKATLIYRRTENLRAVQLLLGHTKLESTVCYLGIEVDDALEISEQTEV
jgi:site-specific recombinase XerC